MENMVNPKETKSRLRKMMFSLFLMTVMICAETIPAFSSSIVINEFLADNSSTVADQDGEYDDWIELYNTTTTDISLSGYYLTDDSADITQWTFPAGTIIPAGGYLIVWADDDGTQDGLHANFKLSASGESIVLSDPIQNMIDKVTFGAQTTDISMGRYPDGTGSFVEMTPTYSATNIIKGDVDGNSAVALEDAILALKITSGITPSSAIYTGADVDGDKKIGLPEAIYALKTVAALENAPAASGTTRIILNNDSITVDGTGASASGSIATITSAGTYSISGTLTDGRIIVNTQDQETVKLVLNGINIYSSTNAPLSIMSAENTIIELADNTENYITDANSYIFENAETDEPDAALFSKSDLTIQGSGSLIVDANYNDGIASKDGLVIAGGTINISSTDDGIRGKDYLLVQAGMITVNAGGDGLKSTNDEDTTKGYISIEDGSINITAAGDAIQAETDVTISGGQFTLTSGGGSSNTVISDLSAKGIKAAVAITIDDGIFTINSADDAIHSSANISINGGSIAASSGDDGIHADTTLVINGGDIRISKSYEGIESADVTINAGNIHIVSSDDGLNVAGGVDGSSTNGRPGQNDFNPSGNNYLYINGGYIVINSVGDGVDVNGSVEMTDGKLIVNGPVDNGNGPLDYDGTFKITGGFIVAAGSSGMAQAPNTSSTPIQYSLLMKFSASQSAGTLVHIRNSAGTGILTFAPAKRYQSIAFSSPELAAGSAYEVYLGGSSTGTNTDGLYEGGTYTPGTRYAGFTVSGIVTNLTVSTP